MLDEPAEGADEPPTVSELATEGMADPPLPTAASESEVAIAVELIGEFAAEVEEHHQYNLLHIASVEHEVRALRTVVQQEREARAIAHG